LELEERGMGEIAEENRVLNIERVSKTFEMEGGVLPVLEGIDLRIGHGEFVCIVGTSGCGKSTLLKIISGLQNASTGRVDIDGRRITAPSVDIGMIFQESRLFPWLSVEKNISFGVHKKMDKKAKKELVRSHIDLVGLSGFERALPKQLSGGMQQRVSIARALINRPGILLLDEPFGALDALTKINMQNEILRIWEVERTTMILVTHDIDEAIYLGDRVVVLSDRPGRIKKHLPIPLARPRDRSDMDFVRLKREIFKEFFGSSAKPVEYFI
jgi:sulfonate transport system ATP-binding protein